MGTVIAWVLVRDRFPGKAVLDVVIDIPFALPTDRRRPGAARRSTGPSSPIGVDVGVHRARPSLLALAFVTLPFVVRTVQPVLEELDTDVEEAAASLGASRFTIVPPDHPAVSLVPAITAGAALSLRPGDLRSTARWCCSAATCPTRPRSSRCGCSTFIEGGNYASAAALATIMLAGRAARRSSLLDIIQRRVARRG